MGTPSTWKCPGCGATVALPADCRGGAELPDDARLDKLARALCGCWVVDLPEDDLTALLGAIMTGDETQRARKRAVSGGRF
jgi:hypothetical protein